MPKIFVSIEDGHNDFYTVIEIESEHLSANRMALEVREVIEKVKTRLSTIVQLPEKPRTQKIGEVCKICNGSGCCTVPGFGSRRCVNCSNGRIVFLGGKE